MNCLHCLQLSLLSRFKPFIFHATHDTDIRHTRVCSKVRTACGSGRLNCVTDGDSSSKINHPLPQAVLTWETVLDDLDWLEAEREIRITRAVATSVNSKP